MSEAERAVDTKKAVLAFNEGAAAAAAGDERAAVEHWQRALDLDPGLVPAALNLVTYWQAHGDVHAELALWQLVLDFDPFDTDHLVLQAAALRRIGELERARETYHRAIAIYPYFKFWYHELAGIYEELGKPHEADLWRGRGASLGADAAEICYEDGLKHVTDGRWSSARTCFEAVLDEFPANLDARLRLARVLENAGTPDEVIAQYAKALELTEAAKGLVHYRRAEFFLKQGALDDAERAFETALATSPRFRRAQRALAALHRHRARRASAAASAASGAGAERSAEVPVSAPVQPRTTEPIVLDPHDIEMVPFDVPLVDYVSPTLRAPNPRLPWPQQVRQVLDHALSVSAPGGQEPRVALVVEPDVELAEPVRVVLAELRSLGRSLRADTIKSHIFVVRTANADENGTLYSGWLGRDDEAELAVGEWRRARPGLPMNQILSTIREAGTEQGFNCLIVVGFGRCEGLDAETPELMATTPLHAICFIRPAYHYIDFRIALADEAHNFIEIKI